MLSLNGVGGRKLAMPAATKGAPAPSGPELFSRVLAICQSADHTSLTKKGVRLLLADDFGKPFVEANKDAIGKMVLEAVKKLTTKQKRGDKAAPGTPSDKAAATDQVAPRSPAKRKRKSAGATPSSTKQRAAAGSKAKARASAVRAMTSAATTTAEDTEDSGIKRSSAPASQPGDAPDEPDSVKPQVKRTRKRKLDMGDGGRATAQQDAEMEQRAASLAPPRSAGAVSAVWAAASQAPGMRNNPTTNPAKRRQQQLENAADAVTDALALSNPEPEELRSAARLAAPFAMLAPEVQQLNERADSLEKAERARLQAQAQKEAAEQQRKQHELIRAEKIRALRAERAEIAKAARAARLAQQAKDQKLREWEEERRAVELASRHLDLDDPIPEEA